MKSYTPRLGRVVVVAVGGRKADEDNVTSIAPRKVKAEP